MSCLPVEIRDRPVLSVNWSLIRVNKHLGAILRKWPMVGAKVEDGRPVLFPTAHGWPVTHEPGTAAGWLSLSIKPIFREGGIPRDSRWVMCWSPDGKRLIGYRPEEALAEAPDFETITKAELAELRRLAEIGRRAQQAG